MLSCPIKEGYNRSSRTILINAERSLLRSGCISIRNLLLGPPEDCVVEGMVLRHILKWRYRNSLRGRLAPQSPQEHHALTAAHIAVDAERAVRISLGDALLRTPEDCVVKGVCLRYIAERGFLNRLRGRFSSISPQEHNHFAAGAGSVDSKRAVRITFGDAGVSGPVDGFVEGVVRVLDIGETGDCRRWGDRQ